MFGLHERPLTHISYGDSIRRGNKYLYMEEREQIFIHSNGFGHMTKLWSTSICCKKPFKDLLLWNQNVNKFTVLSSFAIILMSWLLYLIVFLMSCDLVFCGSSADRDKGQIFKFRNNSVSCHYFLLKFHMQTEIQ